MIDPSRVLILGHLQGRGHCEGAISRAKRRAYDRLYDKFYSSMDSIVSVDWLLECNPPYTGMCR